MGFEPTTSADERPQTYALDRAATGTGINSLIWYHITTLSKLREPCEKFVNSDFGTIFKTVATCATGHFHGGLKKTKRAHSVRSFTILSQKSLAIFQLHIAWPPHHILGDLPCAFFIQSQSGYRISRPRLAPCAFTHTTHKQAYERLIRHIPFANLIHLRLLLDTLFVSVVVANYCGQWSD